MRYLAILVLTFMGLHSVQASDPGIEAAQTEATAFFKGYLDAYNAYDPDAASQNYADTALITGLGDTVRTMTREDMKNLLGRFLNNLKQNGVTKFEWTTLQVKALNDRVAVASNIATRFKADGTVFNTASATLIAHKTDGKWQVLMLNLHKPENILPLGQ